jgi:hypothetical protein
MTARRKVPEDPDISILEATRRKEAALARRRELDLARARGELIKLSSVAPAWARVMGATRNAMLAVPAKLKWSRHISQMRISSW